MTHDQNRRKVTVALGKDAHLRVPTAKPLIVITPPEHKPPHGEVDVSARAVVPAIGTLALAIICVLIFGDFFPTDKKVKPKERAERVRVLKTKLKQHTPPKRRVQRKQLREQSLPKFRDESY
jgi:hypothetical protein